MTVKIDYDGTIVKFEDKLLKDVNDTYGIEIPIAKMYEYRKQISEYYKQNPSELGFYENSEIIDGIEDLFDFFRQNNIDTQIITSSMSGEQKNFKTNHINTHFRKLLATQEELSNPNFKIQDKIIYARTKYKYTTDDVFIDDDITKIKDHIINNEQIGILVNFQERNETPDKQEKRIEILKELENHEKFRIVDNVKDLIIELDKILKQEQKLKKEKEKETKIPFSSNMNF